jgi:outer membrane protein OmpA-like peptidoglycan-associated protein
MRNASRGSTLRGNGWIALLLVVPVLAAGCAANGNILQTDTGKGAVVGGAGGAAIGALIYHSNPWAGALIGAAGGALTGALVGDFMDKRKQDLAKELQPEINAGQAEVQVLQGNALKVTMTGKSAFAPGSAVLNPEFLPTLQKVGGVVKTYGKMTVHVIGHPDARGTHAEREKLAEQRAEAVRVQLLGMGVKPALVSAAGHTGERELDGRVDMILNPVVTQEG